MYGKTFLAGNNIPGEAKLGIDSEPQSKFVFVLTAVSKLRD